MKVGFISDIHIDINNIKGINILQQFINSVNLFNLDILIILGDISSLAINTIKFVELLEQKTNSKIFFIPGNHDIWSKTNSKKAYETLVNHKQCFANKPIELPNNIVIIGDIGWYDYSFVNEHEYTLDYLSRKELNGFTWNDKKHVDWHITDQEMSLFFISKIKDQLEKYKDWNIISATHVIPYEDFIFRKMDNVWNYFNAFMGSKHLGELFKNYNVKYSFFGHSHSNREEDIDGIKAYNVSLGYPSEWITENSLADSIRKSMFILNF